MKLLKLITLAALPFAVMSQDVRAMKDDTVGSGDSITKASADEALQMLDLDETSSADPKVLSEYWEKKFILYGIEAKAAKDCAANPKNIQATIDLLASQMLFLKSIRNINATDNLTMGSKVLDAKVDTTKKAFKLIGGAPLRDSLHEFFNNPLNPAFTGTPVDIATNGIVSTVYARLANWSEHYRKQLEKANKEIKDLQAKLGLK